MKKQSKLHIAPNPGIIEIRGARQNNLKGFDLDVPLGKLNVISGPSGIGKSSLAFDTIYAGGQRRYVETFSPYTRQFLKPMDKPKVDEIRGIPPAVKQRNPVKTTRSTVPLTRSFLASIATPAASPDPFKNELPPSSKSSSGTTERNSVASASLQGNPPSGAHPPPAFPFKSVRSRACTHA